MGKTRIRPAGNEDYAAIVAIYNQAVATGVQTADENAVSLEDKLPWLQKHDGKPYAIYVACVDSTVIGYVALSPYRFGRAAFKQTAEISYYLDTEHQGKGIGSLLIDHALRQCGSLGLKSLVAILLSCNSPSIALLEKFGFESWGLMPDIGRLKTGCVDHLYYGKKI